MIGVLARPSEALVTASVCCLSASTRGLLAEALAYAASCRLVTGYADLRDDGSGARRRRLTPRCKLISASFAWTSLRSRRAAAASAGSHR